MTVRELAEKLKAFPEEAQVVMSKDGEGNCFSPCADLQLGCYVPETTWSGEWYSDEVEEDVAVEAVCLWPTN